MSGYYPVKLGNQDVGKVQVIHQGLYDRFICRCRLTGEIFCRLMVTCGDKRESLGILVPMDGGFGLETSLPRKKLGEGQPEFHLVPKHDGEGKFVPIYPDEPFAYLERLKESFLVIRGGQKGILVPEDAGEGNPQNARSTSTGQWSDPKTSG